MKQQKNQNSLASYICFIYTYQFVYVCEQGEIYESYHTKLLLPVTWYDKWE